MNFEAFLLLAGCLLIASILASKIAFKIGVPVLLLFIGIGMLAGSDGIGGIHFSDVAATKKVGIIALIFILFSGGMDLHWQSAKKSVGRAVSLATVGVLVTASVVGWVATNLLGFSLLEGLLLGSIVASTDAAAVFSTLSHGRVKITERVTNLLELESGCNDPMAIFLTIGFIDAITGSQPISWMLLGTCAVQMLVGAVGGWAVGRVGVDTMRKLRLDEGLFHAVSIVIVLVSYSGTALAGGNGFLAVYVAGVVFGQREFRQKRGLRKFHNGIAWIMQIAMFLVLGLLVFPSQLPAVAVPSIVITLTLMFVARPLGVLLSLSWFRVSIREQTLVAWTGLRGAVPIVLATYPLLAGLPRAHEIFNIVFFVVLLSTLAQGTTIGALTTKLGLEEHPPTEPA